MSFHGIHIMLLIAVSYRRQAMWEELTGKVGHRHHLC